MMVLKFEFLERKYTLFYDYTKAFELFSNLAKKYDNVEAMKKIAQMYYLGIGIEKDEEKSFQIYNQIAKKYKDIEAMREIADMYRNGYVVQEDKNKALSIYKELAEVYNDEEAKYFLAEEYFDQGEYDKSLDLLNELEKNFNNEDSKLILAKMYYNGRFDIYRYISSFENSNKYEINYEKAFNLFNELAEKFDNEDAKYYLAEMYYYGFYVKKDYERAFELFQEVAILDNLEWLEEDARCYIGKMYYNGEYVVEDYKKAFQIFSTLVEKYNNNDATFYLGEMYYYGFYVREDRKKAFELFSKIADHDNDAKAYINDMYEDKIHIKNDSITFEFWEEVMKQIFEIYDQLKELGYEDRVEQQNMTMDIIQAIEDNQNIVVEARCWNWQIICVFVTINALL